MIVLIKKYLLNDNFKTFKNFIDHYTNPKFLSVCQKSWDYNNLIITCNTCSGDPNSCFCLDCFLKGNHQDHSITVRFGSNENCDCGDSQLVQPCGFCPLHSGSSNDPDTDQIDKQTILVVTEFSSKIFSLISPKNCGEIFNILSSLLSTGDGMRRCISKGIQSHVENFISQITELNNPRYTSNFFNFFGQLINDLYLRNYFSHSVF